MRKAVVGIGFVIVVGVVAFFAFRDKEGGLKFKTEKVSRGDIVAMVTATGAINPVTLVSVGTQVSGTIKHIYADFNSPVKKGQLIAEIDPASFEAQVEQARATLLLSKANMEKAEAQLLDAKRTLDRHRELFSMNFIAKSTLDGSQTNYEIAMAQVSAAKAQVAQAEAALKYAETNLRYTRILSPVDGIVISRNVDVGQTVAASLQAPTLFTIAQDLTKMQIDTNVHEADIGRVRVGQVVEFTVDAYPESPFRGKVSQVRNAPINIQNVVTYNVVINVDNPELKLKPGMTADVSIITERKNGVLRIPNAALRFRPDKGDIKYKGPGVWVIEDKSPKRIEVVTGISDGNYTELLSGNIKEGQELIVESLTKRPKVKDKSPARLPRLP